MSALLEYVRAWVAGDAARIADAVAEDCLVVESNGPVHRGRHRVRKWATAWFEEGGVVHRWDVLDHIVAGDREVIRWTVETTWRGERGSADGATIARVRDGLVLEVREYQTTQPPYDWTGIWR